MENRAYALMTGLFVVGMLAALLVAGWWLSDSSRDRVPYLVVSENSVAGLSPYATVRFRGVEVGQVTSIDFAGDGTGEIHVMLELDPDAPVTDHTMASMSSQGMMGRTVVDLEDSAPGGERLHSSKDNPVRIPLDGLIMREPVGGLFSAREDKIEVLLRRIRAAHNDPAVRAIILEVNSPGGAITPTDEIYAALLRFRESSGDRRIVVFMRDIAASGGYYAAMAGDWLIAEPTSLVGSIGVIMQMLNWHELSERIGISQTSVQSGGNKDLMNPFRPTSDEEIAILQELVDSMHDRFTGIVQEQRGLDDAAMGQVADGRIMDSARALQDGLIDEIGYWDDAVRRTAVVLGVPSVRVVRYETRTDWSTWFASVRSSMAWRSLWSEAQQPQMLYLWQP